MHGIELRVSYMNHRMVKIEVNQYLEMIHHYKLTQLERKYIHCVIKTKIFRHTIFNLVFSITR